MSHAYPFGILAELTYGCPLHCPYCSNPVDLGDRRDELGPAEWERVLAEGAELGALQAHLSGGEPLLRRDLARIVRAASAAGLYTNLITSGLGLSARRAEELRDAGLDHVQVSVQAAEAGRSDAIAGLPSFQRKLKAARLVKELGWPLTLNVVLHRRNLDQIGRIIDLAESLGADRVELANTQYYGWALVNRAALLPSREQLRRAETVVRDAVKRLRDRMEIIWVLPDYYEKYPKPCMGGWGARQLTVTPYGDVLPCPTAHEVPLPRANVRERSLRWIWEDSPVFTAFRGTDWMPEPCRSCARRDVDFGGCRCQAYALTGDAGHTDPVCELSPDHNLVADAVAAANADDLPLAQMVPRRSYLTMIIRRPGWARRIAGALLATMVAAAVAACGGSGSSGSASGGSKSSGGITNVTLGYVPYVDDAALFYAQDGGIFRKHGLNVTFVPQASPVAVEASMASGTEQFGFITAPVLINLNSKGVGVKCVSSVDGNQPTSAANDTTALVAAKGSGIKSIADLAGKNVAEVQLTSLNSLATMVLAKRAGIDPKSIHQIAMPFPQMPAALAQGRVQAAVIVSPFIDTALKEGATVLTHPNVDLFPGGTVTCLDAQSSYISSNPKVVAGFRAAMDTAIAYCHGHQSACKATLASHLKLPPAVAQKETLSTNWNPTLNPASLTLIGNYMKQYGQVSSVPPASKMIWNP